ncbi:hypothetical protein AOQ84DRAFT_271973, partial [Glonium stellatum]
MEDRGSQLITVIVLFFVLSWLTVILRCYVRARVKVFFGADDVLALLSLFVFTATCSVFIVGVQAAIGKHFTEVSLESYLTGIKMFYIAELLYIALTALVKLSISVTLLRIAVEPAQIYALYSIMTITILFTVLYFFFILFGCRPLSFTWKQILGGTNGSCFPPSLIISVSYGHSILLCLVDLTLAILPIFLVWNMKLNRHSKLSVALILAFGSMYAS